MLKSALWFDLNITLKRVKSFVFTCMHCYLRSVEVGGADAPPTAQGHGQTDQGHAASCVLSLWLAGFGGTAKRARRGARSGAGSPTMNGISARRSPSSARLRSSSA